MLENIGNNLGKVLKIDAHSLTGERKRYAALCVLMKKEKKMPKGAWLGKIFQELIVCEGPWFCESCNKFGHQYRNCGQSNAHQMKADQNLQEEVDGHGIQWRNVKPRERNNNKKGGQPKAITRWIPKKSKDLKEDVGPKGKMTATPMDKRENVATSLEVGESSCTLANTFELLQELGDLEGFTTSKAYQEAKGGNSKKSTTLNTSNPITLMPSINPTKEKTQTEKSPKTKTIPTPFEKSSPPQLWPTQKKSTPHHHHPYPHNPLQPRHLLREH